MRVIKNMSILVVFSFFMGLSFLACTDENVEVKSGLAGIVKVVPSPTKNGDVVEFMISDCIISTYSEINGKAYYPVVHYLIDNVEIAVSSEKKQPFTAKWVVRDLSVGEHVLSVEVTPSRKGASFTNMVSSSTITVTE